MGDDGSGFDWTSLFQGPGDTGYNLSDIVGPPAPTDTSGLDPTSTFGMGDRGLGSTDPTLTDSTGTLTPQAIQQLTQLAQASGLLNPAQMGLGGFGTPGSIGVSAPGQQGGGLGSLLSSLGGLGSLPMLLGLLGPLLGGAYAANRTNQATNQVLAGIGNANTAIKGILGGPSIFQPYTTMGQTALGNLGGMRWNPLQFGALGGSPAGGGALSGSPLSGINLGMLAGTRR